MAEEQINLAQGQEIQPKHRARVSGMGIFVQVEPQGFVHRVGQALQESPKVQIHRHSSVSYLRFAANAFSHGLHHHRPNPNGGQASHRPACKWARPA